MSIRTKEELKLLFEQGDKPTQQDFQDLLDSLVTATMPGDTNHIVTKNRVYIFGGYTGDGGKTASIQTAVINSDGTLGTWASAGSLPAAYDGISSVVVNSKVYLFIGNTNLVYVAPINADGTIGALTAMANRASASIGIPLITSSRIYLLSRQTGGTGTSQYATFTGGYNEYLDKSYSIDITTDKFFIPDYRNLAPIKTYIKH